MKKSTLLMMFTLATGPLMGQTAKELADNLTLPALTPGATKLELPQVPEGVLISIGGSDYEQIIGLDGSVKPVISDTLVQVFFKVTKDGETAESKDYEVLVPAADQSNPKPATIPAILQWKGGQGEWQPGSEIRIASGAEPGVGSMLADDFKKLLGDKVSVESGSAVEHANIVLELKKSEGETQSEAYTMEVTPEKVSISADSAKGLYWGTRTLLQILAREGKVPAGMAVDMPRYRVRGFMLDIARTHYSLQDLRDVVDAMAWYKMNDLHLVINNNYIFHENYVDAGRDPFKESYSAFRLESNVKGADGTPLTAQDLSYSKKEFREFIDYANARGVNIVPEFDTPGHALSFTRVRPDLIYKGPMRGHVKRRCEMLDAANSETLKFVSGVFDEYLFNDPELNRPVFENCVVHVGSDEFYGEAEDYRRYTDGVLHLVLSRGYTPRVWGSLSAKKGKNPVVSKGVQMNLWSTGWMKPEEAVALGYDVINTNDGQLYVVPFANYYRADKNHKWLYNNWIPNRIGGLHLPAGHPQLLGATFAVWNDMTDLRHNGYGMRDIWESLTDTMDVLSQKMWGPAAAPRSFPEHRELSKSIGHGPAFATPSLWHPEQFSGTWEPNVAEQNASAEAQPGIAPEYHLTAELELEEVRPGEEQTLLSGPEGELIAVMKDGTVGFRRADTMEYSWDVKLPVGKKITLELIATPGKTRLIIDGQEIEQITLTKYRNAEEDFRPRTKNVMSTFVLPRGIIGKSLRGKVHSLKVQY